jgi:23S rRNA (adenine2030-N6)-methyltransferase
MNYKHIYHAGNFADVTKHLILMALITSLKAKNKPFCYIDTHAGAGYYDLFSDVANKTKEFTLGIEKIIQAEHPPMLVKEYLTTIHDINNKLTHSNFASLRYYPGSPLIARHLLRASDRIVACELHPEEYQALRTTFNLDKQVAVHHTDGFLGLKAFLPPKEHRGLILIDPPYEDPDEFNRIARTLPIALKRFETGIYAIWYPIKEKIQLERFYRTLSAAISQPIMIVELTIYPDIANHLNGSGLAIINPPWQFETAMHDILPWIWKALTINNQGAFRAYSLK